MMIQNYTLVASEAADIFIINIKAQSGVVSDEEGANVRHESFQLTSYFTHDLLDEFQLAIYRSTVPDDSVCSTKMMVFAAQLTIK